MSLLNKACSFSIGSSNTMLRSSVLRQFLNTRQSFLSTTAQKHSNEQKNNELDPDLKVLHKELVLKLPSRRLDAILKRTSGIGTTSLEKTMASSGVRVNGEVQKKKSYNVDAGDEIDMWLAPVSDNPELARTHHVEIVEYNLGEHNYEILVSVDRSYIVKNWKGGYQ